MHEKRLVGLLRDVVAVPQGQGHQVVSQQRLEAFVGDQGVTDGHMLQPRSRGVPEQVDDGIHVRVRVMVIREEPGR